LRVDGDGLTLAPHEVDARLSALCRWEGGGLKDALFGGAFIFSHGDPWDVLENLEQLIVFLARYMRQSIRTIERMALDEASRYARHVSHFIAIENGAKSDGSDRMALDSPPVEPPPRVAAPGLLPGTWHPRS